MSYKSISSPPPKRIVRTKETVDRLETLSLNELKELWRLSLEQGLHGICFSMYEDGQEPGDEISREQVERRIKILNPFVDWVRCFSCTEGNELIPEVAKEHGLKNLVGAWLSDDLEQNELEIQGLISLAKKGLVDIAAVGNEVLYRGELTEEELLAYIRRVKEALPRIEVGYVDAYYEFSNRPSLVDACDIILSNCYPYWEGTKYEDALGHMQHMYQLAKDAGKGKKVIITETGWPSEGEAFEQALPSETNAMKYFINSQTWADKAGVELFYFSSFDESWKVGDEGDVGAYWGLWDKNENLKF